MSDVAQSRRTAVAAGPVLESFALKDRVALVTGAGQGLGAAMAEALGEAGAHVVLNDVDPARLEERCAEFAKRSLSVEGLPFDVTDADAVGSSLRRLSERHGRLDILVNNAGIAVYQGIDDHDLADWHRVMEVNLNALFIVGREAARLMAKNGYGRIINISSVLGLASRPGIPSYVVSKHGVVGLTHAMASDLGGRGITCNAIAPGYFQTAMSDTLTADQEFYRMIANRTPLKRWADPHELKGPVVFLASPAASFVNGLVMTVDGGMTASLF
jgi:gluconate 5-dehydrogenase